MFLKSLLEVGGAVIGMVVLYCIAYFIGERIKEHMPPDKGEDY